ncbi:HD domain-containing protein [Paenibacillus ginsengarvi]|uniref:HD domain-containing protein n=2 Tax=Paenibacillus ginsengarvi TaxID=400777 RepID=A0A3B0AY69_9BACL|nr:HD domain-containing protein [Paenibacillus ginsengarvi]
MNGERLEQEAAAFARNEPQTAFLLKRLKRHHLPTYKLSLMTAYYTRLLAKELFDNDEDVRRLYRTALLQDIGKLHIDADVLDNRYRLYEGEMLRLQEHPKHSANILEPLIESFAVDGEAVLHHHENLDGTGYPFGLTYESISQNARVLRVADTFATLTDRHSSFRLSHEEALEELYRWSDILFDGEVAELMNRLYRDRLQGGPEKGESRYAGAARNRNS